MSSISPVVIPYSSLVPSAQASHAGASTVAPSSAVSSASSTVVSFSGQAQAIAQRGGAPVSSTLTVNSIELGEGTSPARAGKLILRFNEDVEKGLGLIQLKDSNGQVLENISIATSPKVRVEGNTLTVELSRDLDYNSRYSISFAAGTVKDQEGQGFRGAVYGFRTERDLTGPELRTANGLQGLSRHAHVVMHFNEKIRAGTGMIHLRDAAGDILESFDVTDSERVRIVGNALIISPTQAREYSSEFSLSMGSGVIKDLANNAFAGVDAFRFGTGADKDAPVIQRFTPLDGEGRAPTRTNVVLRFSEEIRLGSGQIQLRDAGGRVIESFDASSERIRINGKTLTVVPGRELAPNSRYSVSFAADAVRDLAGNSMRAVSNYGFFTGPPASQDADTVAPVAVSYTPSNGSNGVDLAAEIVVRFSEAIRRGDGDVLLKNAQGQLIERLSSTSDRIEIVGDTLTLRPTLPLNFATDYFLTFESGVVEDLAGNPYEGSSNYGFRTVDPPDASPPLVVSQFSIEVVYGGDAAYQSYFEEAAAFWSRVIVGNLPSVGAVDDLRIVASIEFIDGVGGTLGSASPTLLRSSSLLPYQGEMRFDTADMAGMLSNGILTRVILHEMGHVLGLGTLWELKSFNTDGNGDVVAQYTGSKALQAYQELSGDFGAAYVPLETTGGAGTAFVHWSETVFDRELMTGYAESGGSMPVSTLTVAALEDLGYVVNYTAAESYTLPTA